MINNFGRIIELRKELQSVRKKIDIAFKEYEAAPEGSGEKYEAEIAVMKFGKIAQELKAKIRMLNERERIIS